MLRLKGLLTEAQAFTGTANFADANKAAWAAPIMAYLKAHPELGWVGDGTNLNPAGVLTAQAYYKVMLETLGYKANTAEVVGDFAFDKTIEFAATKGLVKAATATTFTVDNVATATVEALKATVKGGTTTLAATLVAAGKIDAAKAATAGVYSTVATVATVTANTAKSFLVKFNNAVADTSKVTFIVKRSGTAVVFTTTWNEAKTEATLTGGSKFAEGEYVVNAIGADYKIVIEKEKVTKVDFNTTSITRFSDISGYVGFAVYNQYNENITDAALGRGLLWTSSTSVITPTVNYKTGLLTITHNAAANNQLVNLTTVVVTARDTTTGFVASKNLDVSKTIAAINAVKINGIKNEKGETVDLVYSSGKTYYLDFSVTDANGAAIKDYNVLNATNNGLAILMLSATNNTNITLTKDHDPLNSSNMAYRIDLGTAPTFDTPITFIANAPFSGVNATFTATLKKSAALQTFRMLTPSETVSKDKAVEVPFEAFDQNGSVLTKYADIAPYVTLSDTAASFVKQSDGTAKLFVTYTSTGTKYLTATVPASTTGSFTQISFEVRNTAIATKINALRASRAVTNGSSYYMGRISAFDIRDQFDSKMNLRADSNNTLYKIIATSSAPTVVAVGDAIAASGTGSQVFNGDTKLYIYGGTVEGSATITYTLFNDANSNGTVDVNEYVDEAATVVYNMGMDKITDASIALLDNDTVYNVAASVIYAATNAAANMYTDFEVFGKTSSGMEVELPASAIASINQTNSKFTLNAGAMTVNYNNAFASGIHSDSTTITALVNTPNGVFEKSLVVKASDDAVVTTEIITNLTNADKRSGAVSVNNNVYTVTAAYLTSLNTKTLYQYGANGNTDAAGLAPFYFSAGTNYKSADGSYGGVFNNIVVTRATTNVGTFTVNSATGVATVVAPTSGDTYTVTVLSNAKTLTIVIKVK